MGGESVLDISRFDAIATQLDLVVEAAQVLEGPVGTVAHQVAGAVEAPLAFGILDEALGSEVGLADVAARQARTTDHELSRDPERNGSEVAVPDREDRVCHRRSQGHGVLAPRDPVDAGPDGGLRGPVEVPELPHLRMQRTGQVGGELLPRAHSDERGISLPARVEEHAPQ